MPDDTRPTFGQALEAASAGAGEPSPSPDPAAQPSEATGVSSAPTDTDSSFDPATPATAATQPVAGDSTPSPVEDWDPAQGPIPVDRHKAILENTRTRARDEAQQALQQQYGWALQMGPQNFQAVTTLAQQWANDPVAFVLGALDDLTASPEYAPQLRSHVAKLLARRPPAGNGQGQAAPTDTPEPEPDIVVDGYSWYSAQKLAERDRWFSNKLLTQVRQELAPLKEDMTSRHERDALIQATQQANHFASTTLAEMHKLPYFKEQKAEIERVFRQMPPMPDAQVGQAIRDAYIQVLATKVFPTLDKATRSEVLSDFNRKAAASTRNPANGSAAIASRPKTFEEALRRADAANNARG